MPNTIDFAPQIAQKLNLAVHHVANVICLFDEGATIPFIARYRKEMTGTMNEENVAAVQKRLEQLVELQKRKESVIASIREQEKLTPELEQKILNAKTLQEIEDLYLPYKPKRRTRAAIAREKGLEPLAAQIMAQNVDMVDRLAARYVNAGKGVNDIEEALQGAKDIMAEWVSENINGRNRIRKIFHIQGDISSAVVKGKEEEGKTYQQYFDFREPISQAPSHRLLALFRAEEEGMVKLKIKVDDDFVLNSLESIFLKNDNQSSELVREAIADSWKRLLEPSIETEIRNYYKEKADETAIKVFAENLKQLLLAAPMGQKRVLAIDPGFRTGCKVVVLSETGALLHNETIYPHPSHQGHRHRQRHGGTRDRGLHPQHQVRSRPDGRDGERERRIGLFRLQNCPRRVPRLRHHRARRGQHRSPTDGSLGRVGEDRPEEHWRGTVPARCRPEETRREPRPDRGELRERCRRGT